MTEELTGELIEGTPPAAPWAQVDALRDLLQTAQRGVTLVGGVQAFVLGREHELVQVDLEQYAPTPRRKHGKVSFADVRSFVGYIDAHAEGDATTVYRLKDQAQFVAVLNGPERGGARLPGWSDHRAELLLEPSVEWKAWSAISGKYQSQVEFASFLEDHARDARKPDAATLIELARTIEGAQSATFGSSVRLDNGARAFTYRETIDAKAGQDGRLEIPGELELVLRPFAASEKPFVVKARFRYRLQQGSLLLGIELDRPDLVLETVHNELDEQVGDLTGYPVWVARALP